MCLEVTWDSNQLWTLGPQGDWKEEIEEVETSLDPMDNVKG